jgi:hypothetical protein
VELRCVRRSRQPKLDHIVGQGVVWGPPVSQRISLPPAPRLNATIGMTERATAKTVSAMYAPDCHNLLL